MITKMLVCCIPPALIGFMTACEGTARFSVREIGYTVIDSGVNSVSPRIDAATASAKATLHSAASTIARSLAAEAKTGFGRALGKLETGIDQGADDLSRLAAHEVDATLDQVAGEAEKLWVDAINASFDRAQGDLEQAASRRREAAISALDLTFAAKRERDLGAVRVQAWKIAYETYAHTVEGSRAGLAACEAEATKLDPMATAQVAKAEECQRRFQLEVEAGRSAAVAAVDAAVLVASSDLDHAHTREQLEAQAIAQAQQWREAQVATISARATELRKQGRERADAMMSSIRQRMKDETEHLRSQLREHLKLPSADSLSLGDDAEVARLVNSALDGFIDQLGERIKTTLRKEARNGVDALVKTI